MYVYGNLFFNVSFQCLVNGLTFSKLHQEATQCGNLEMFFCGFPRMIGLHLFPNLHKLCIIGQSISRLEGLSPLIHLKELWVCECQIQVSNLILSTRLVRPLVLR